jgi:cytochrome c peroxidase
MFWDLRSESLEKQALEPIKAFEEMRGHAFTEKEALPIILKRLQNISSYQSLFTKAFGKENSITIENLGKAIASFERTLIANNSRFDQYMRGDKMALSQNEIDGMMAFLKAGCSQCHSGPMFSDYKTHAIGIDDNEKLTFIDDGFKKRNEFRTPTLRNLRFTFPYMHNGTIKTVENVVEFYEDLSGSKIRNPRIQYSQLDPLIKNLKVDFKDISSITEFLNTLNDNRFDKNIPKKVPSGLKVGGEIYE